MADFESLDTFDRDYEWLKRKPLSHLLSSAADRSLQQSMVAIAYLDLDKLLIDDTIFVDQLFSCDIDKKIALGLWLGDWDRSISIERVVGYLAALRTKLYENGFRFQFILPNPYVSLEIARLYSLSLEDFYQRFINLAPCETQPIVIEDNAFQLLKRVMSLGVRTNIALDISLVEDRLHVARGPDLDGDDDLILSRLCGTAFELKEALAAYSSYYSVQVVSFSKESPQTLSSSFAVPLLKALCFLRHILPTTVQLYASPELLGRNLYILINELGVCSRSEGAFESATAKMLNLPLISEISPV